MINSLWRKDIHMSIVREIPKLNSSLENLLKHSHRKTYAAKNIIIHEGDVPDSLYYIIEGSVSVQAENESGDEIILAHLNEGDFFGEAGLFKLDEEGESKRTAWIIARTKSVIAEISYDQFRKIVSEDPRVMFLLTGQIFNRLKKTSLKVRDLVFLDVKGFPVGYFVAHGCSPLFTVDDGKQKGCEKGRAQGVVGAAHSVARTRTLAPMTAQPS